MGFAPGERLADIEVLDARRLLEEPEAPVVEIKACFRIWYRHDKGVNCNNRFSFDLEGTLMMIRARNRRGICLSLAGVGVMISILLWLLSCATVPVTERKTFNLVSDSELLSLSTEEYSKVLKESKLSKDQRKVQMVKRVGQDVARATEGFLKESGMESDLENYKWEFNLIEDDKTINAWCMPGGKVAFYTGILPLTRDENGLAVVMGHEIAHAVAKHGNERMSEGLLVQLGGAALSLALSKQPAQTTQLFMTVYGVTANVGVLLPYSRLHEKEADRIGLILMAKAGYDPREAIPFWQRMNEKGGDRPPEFLSTHPAPETRIQEIQSFIPEAMKYYKGK